MQSGDPPEDEYTDIDPRRRLVFKMIVVVVVIGLLFLIADLFFQLVF
ncbi:MAG: hypothetical protein M3214_14230 [Actinomycetota bacterium]|nr:hypothetical protein [Actinomycetota bacterium]